MNTEQQPQPSKLMTRVWLPLVIVMLVGIYGALFIPAFAGQAQNPQNGTSSVIVHALFFYVLWKQQRRKGWQGALIGVVAGVLAFMAAVYVGSMNRVT